MSTERMNVKNSTSCDINPDVWIDFVANELDPAFKNDLALHAQGCLKCKTALAEFRALTKSVKSLSHVAMPDDDFFNSLESKIMASVEKTAIDNVVPFRRPDLKIVVSATAAAFILVFGTLFAPSVLKLRTQSKEFIQPTGEADVQLLVQNSNSDIEIFSDVINSHQDSDELVLDAAAEKLSHMTDKEARTIIDEMKK